MSTKKQKQAQELLDAMNVLEKEKGIKKEVVIEALTDALEKAYKTNYHARMTLAAWQRKRLKTSSCKNCVRLNATGSSTSMTKC